MPFVSAIAPVRRLYSADSHSFPGADGGEARPIFPLRIKYPDRFNIEPGYQAGPVMISPAHSARSSSQAMPEMKRRSRMISVRLSEEEYSALRHLCSLMGARSVSDLTRDAMRAVLKRATQD